MRDRDATDPKALDLLGWLAELREQFGYKEVGLVEPILQPDTIIDRWFRGHLALHVNLRVRSGLAHVDPADLCADIQYAAGSAPIPVFSEYTVRTGDPLNGAVWQGPDWLDLTVLTVVRQTAKRHKYVPRDLALSSYVRLVSANNCDICPASTGEPLPDGVIEVPFGIADGEIDPSQLPLGQVWRAPSRDECPREMVESAMVARYDIGKMQAPGRWDGADRVDPEHKALELRVILGLSKAKAGVTVGVAGDVRLERLRVDYRPPKLQPRTVKQSDGLCHHGLSFGKAVGADEPSE